MKAHWLIEEAVFPATAPGIIAALEANGSPWTRYEDGLPDVALPRDGACVVFWGSLGAAYGERVAARWVPGAIGEPDRFRCSVYHPQLRPLLANQDGLFTTVRELVDDPEAVLRVLGNPERVFVRPDSPLKPFSGRRLEVSGLSLGALDHGFYYEDEDLPVVVSSVKQVGREWRFVVAEGAVVAGCEYDVDRRGRPADISGAARALAGNVARHDWQAAPIYVVDICDVGGSLAVLELNPFSGADLYACDANAVVVAAGRVAGRLHDLHAAQG
jgi:hypothetical protein